MGIVFRQSAKTSIIVLIGSILGALVIWLSTKYIEDKSQFGFIQNLTNNAVTISQTLLFGLNSTLAVFIQRYMDNDRKRKLLLTICFAVPAVLSVLAIGLYYLLRTWVIGRFQLADAQYVDRYFDLLPVYILLFIYQLLLEQYLGSQMKVAIAAFMREVLLRFVNIMLLLLYGFQYISFSTFVLGMVLMYIVPVFIFFLLSFRTKAFGFSFNLADFTKAEYAEIIHFSWYHFLLSMALILMYTMDMLLIPIYHKRGFEGLAVYRVSVFFISFLQLPSKALIPASLTVLSKAFADKDLIKAKDIFVRSSINILIPTVAMAIIIGCNLQNAVAVIKNGYAEIVPVFFILIIGVISNIATGMNDQVLSIANYYKFNFYVSLVLIIILFLSLKFLVPIYGIYGAAWSTTATLILFNIIKFIFVWKKLDMQPFSKNTVLVLLAALPALAAGYFFPYLFSQTRHIYVHSFMDAALRSLVIIIVYMLMLLWLKPSKDLVEYLASIKKNKRLF